MIGRTLKQYRIEEAIGAGGMGVVYRAHDTRLSRDVALKVLPAGALADENARKRFRKEAFALSRLSHPHVASLFDFDTTDDGTDFLVMELVPGPSLDTRLKRGPLPERDVVRLGAQVLRALVAAHEQGVLHRDLKPQNLKLTADGLVKVLDFGLARVGPVPGDSQTTDSASGSVAGTPPYMSPEQLLGKEVDARTDVYAAGVVLYEMATGRRPFGETSGPQLVAKILNEPMPPPREVNPDVSPVLEQVILKATDKDRELRHQTARDLLVDLERLAAGMAPSTASGRAIASAGGRWRVPPFRAWTAVALLAALLAVAFLLLRPVTPRVTSFRTIARRAHAFNGLATDGTNAYFAESREPQDALVVVPLSGESPRELPLPWNDGFVSLYVFDLVPDPPSILVGKNIPLAEGWELWRFPLVGGAPTRLDRFPLVRTVRSSRRGDRVAYVGARDGGALPRGKLGLFAAAADGSAPRLLVDPGEGHLVQVLGWRPGDESIRFLSTEDARAFWDVTSSGAVRQPAFRGEGAIWDSGPDWSPDGRFFLYVDDGVLLARSEASPAWRGRSTESVRLAAPPSLTNLRFTPDGHRVVGLVSRPGTEIVRFDLRTREIAPLLGGARAAAAEFSPDGAWVAWVSLEGSRGVLWRSRPDGSAALRLTDTKRHDVTPWAPVRFSPDGRRVAFSAWGDPPESSRSPQLFVVDVETGRVERAVPEEREVMQVDPCWAPDGRSLVYAVPPGGERGEVRLRRVDLATQAVTPLPGAAGLFSPRVSRDGRLLAIDFPAQQAEKGDRTHVRFLDPGHEAWRALVVDAPNLNYPAWSRDGRHIYATSTPVDGPRTIVRFDVATGRVERLGRIDGLRSDLWLELTPDGAPMVHRDVSQREIVVMDWEVR